MPSTLTYRETVDKRYEEQQNQWFNDVLQKTLKEEGEYEDDLAKIDAPTNMGIQQATLNRFKRRHPDLSKGYPTNVKNITRDQAKQIYKKDYYDAYRIGDLKHAEIRATMFDSYVNHTPHGPALWAQKSINKHTKMKVKEDDIFGSETIAALNAIDNREDLKNVNNEILNLRHEDYLINKENNPDPRYSSYTTGLPNRFKRFMIK